MNHNKLFPLILESQSADKIREFLSFTLSPEVVIEQFRRTKRFEMLPLFFGILRFETNCSHRRAFEEMAALALVGDNQEGFDTLLKYASAYLSKERIAHYYGAHFKGEYSAIPSWVEASYHECSPFLSGIVARDNLPLFLQVLFHWSVPLRERVLTNKEKLQLCWYAGHFHTCALMKHFGFTAKTIKHYLDGAASSKRATVTVEYIASIIDGWRLGEHYKENLVLYGTGQANTVFSTYLQEKGYLSFDEQERSELPLDWSDTLF